MTKIEMYNNIVNVTKATGQGVSNIIGKINHEYEVLLNELENEGLIDGYPMSGDIFYVPKGCYSPFKNKSKNLNELTFVRIYLNIDDLGLGLTREYYLSDNDRVLKYEQWLNENIIELEKMKNLPYYDEPVSNETVSDETTVDSLYLKKETVEFVKTRNWFIKNETISMSIEKCNEGLKYDLKYTDIHNKLLKLYKTLEREGENVVNEINKQESELNVINVRSTFRENFMSWAKTQPMDEQIQELIK